MQGNFTFLQSGNLKKQAAEIENALCQPIRSDMQTEAIAFKLYYFWESYQKQAAKKYSNGKLSEIRQAPLDEAAYKFLQQAACCELEGCTKEQLLQAAAAIHRDMSHTHRFFGHKPFDPKIYSLQTRLRADDIRAWERPPLANMRTMALDSLKSNAQMQKLAGFFDRQGLREKVDGEIEQWLNDTEKHCMQNFPYSKEQQNLEYYSRLAPRAFLEEMELEQQHSMSAWGQLPEEAKQAWQTEVSRWQQSWQQEWLQQQKQRIKEQKKLQKQRKRLQKREKPPKTEEPPEQNAQPAEPQKAEEPQSLVASPVPGMRQLLPGVQPAEQQLLQNVMLKKWFAAFVRKRNEWLQQQIDAARKKLLAQLQKQMEQFEKLRQLLAPFGEGLGRLWDMSKGDLKNISWEVLQYYEQLFAQEQSLKELADLLGRYRKAEHTYEKRLIEIFREVPGSEAKYGQGGQRIGLEYGNKLSRILSRELATLSDEQSELLFLLKYSQKRLLQYQTMLPIATTEQIKDQKEEQYAKEENDQGPFILCVDTSGSMHGLPEQTAKMLCYVLARHAAESKRKLFLINFSTGIDS